MICFWDLFFFDFFLYIIFFLDLGVVWEVIFVKPMVTGVVDRNAPADRVDRNPRAKAKRTKGTKTKNRRRGKRTFSQPTTRW